MNERKNITEFDLKETQIAIKTVKDYFQNELAQTLNLVRVTAPLIVRPETGLNDNLSGIEKPVNFQMHYYGFEAEIVQSLAKWKRYALKKYGFSCYEGLYTDMNAIRSYEQLDAIHSAYVDQWDWELIIQNEDRNEQYLRKIVQKIYTVLLKLEKYMVGLYPNVLKTTLPSEIAFISSQELENIYPDYSPKEREREAARKYKAVFIIGIGETLNSGQAHDVRSPDYDDWTLNGDMILYNEILDDAFEISSMGIRVDSQALDRQLQLSKTNDRRMFPYHQAVLHNELPYTIGGGIGQSRLCQFFLRKQHIGEVQASVWDDDTMEECKKKHIRLL